MEGKPGTRNDVLRRINKRLLTGFEVYGAKVTNEGLTIEVRPEDKM